MRGCILRIVFRNTVLFFKRAGESVAAFFYQVVIDIFTSPQPKEDTSYHLKKWKLHSQSV